MSEQMLKQALAVMTVAAMSMSVWAQNTIVEMKTNLGSIEIELFNDKAPISTNNFIE